MALLPRSIDSPYLNRAARPAAPNGVARAKSGVTAEYVRAVIYTLNRDANLWASELPVALNQILEIGIASLDCQVASVWQVYDGGKKLSCLAQHELGLGQVEPSADMQKDQYGLFFTAIDNHKVLAVEDSLADARTEELVAPYLIPHDVGALLAGTIQRGGCCHGYIVFEQLAQSRQWTQTEKEFVAAIAELVNQIIQVCALRKQNQLLGLLNSISHGLGAPLSAAALAQLGMEKLRIFYPDIWAGFYKIEQPSRAAQLVCFIGDDIPKIARQAGRDIPLNNDLCMTLKQTDEIFIIPDCSAWDGALDLPFMDIAIAVGTAAVAAVPLKTNGELLGFILIWSRQKIYNVDAYCETYRFFGEIFELEYAKAVSIERLTSDLHHDSLTGVYNRQQLLADLEQLEPAEANANHATIQPKEPEKCHLCLLIELKGFKQINDTLGHSHANSILVELSKRLVEVAKNYNDVVIYRLDGAELGLLGRGFDSSVEKLMAQLQVCISRPVLVSGLQIVITARFGIAQTPNNYLPDYGLLKSADIALGWAKKADNSFVFAAEPQLGELTPVSIFGDLGKDQMPAEMLCNKTMIYEPCRDIVGPDDAELTADLSRAIEYNELILYYQPQFDLNTGKMVSCEALLRWKHEQHGFIAPEKFIRLAERGKLVRTLTMWVLRQSVSQISIFKLMEMDVPVAINVSALDIVDLDFPAQIRDLFGEFEVDPEDLVMEITEAVLMSDPERSLAVISRLEKYGLRVDIDEFGAGFSSLACMHQLPLSSVKINRNFIKGLVDNSRHQRIVRSIIGMAHGLGVKVIAVGIEDKLTLELLKSYGCDLGQGFHFGKPVSAAEFIAGSGGQ
ncbi:MAG: EAL domain-containing protein [Pseudomonadales bacterium]|nr:EAL domain-containing protein [Pseudomonadales bacterium]